jgi:hypothetical protein
MGRIRSDLDLISLILLLFRDILGMVQIALKTVSVNTTETMIDSACTGTSAATSLTATNVSFAQGQVILIHQTQGTGAGTWMRNTIQGYTAGTITTFRYSFKCYS